MGCGAATAPHQPADNCKEKQMSSDGIHGVCDFSGYGPMYIADRKRVREFRENKFSLQGLRHSGDFWVTNELIVALGATYRASEHSRSYGA
jgi:hypothetical protein